ncbi:HAD family hydrolase [Lysinibacillus sp. LZ02]|uniref:HAD family hydrolase n=1 Tax=Lysinibacillus sp. LZ02 TaxID=3420668 RepID=UPI003D35FCE9
MRILTTDLDRTLIFSKRTVNRPLSELICVEYVDGEALSFISHETEQALRQLSGDAFVIPVTTRAGHQYERIELFQRVYKPPYAIVANGGIVLKDGKRDTQWDAIMQQLLAESMPFHEMAHIFATDWQHPMFQQIADADQLFYVLMLEKEKIDWDCLNDLRDRMERVGWSSYINGRKLYVLPKCLTKERAVQYVLEQMPYTIHYAAGDSIMDLGMLELTDLAFTPAHGELFKEKGYDVAATVIEDPGVCFTEQLLLKFNEKVNV